LAIANAPDSLLAYINDTIGPLTENNLLPIVDAAPALGYEVDDAIKAQVCDMLGNNYELCTIVNNRTSLINHNDMSIESIVEYARLTNRLPVYVYTTGLPKEDTDEIKHLNKGKNYNVFAKLMVSYTSTLIGSKKESWQTNAEKIIYLQ
jgi:hypothetical protein